MTITAKQLEMWHAEVSHARRIIAERDVEIERLTRQRDDARALIKEFLEAEAAVEAEPAL